MSRISNKKRFLGQETALACGFSAKSSEKDFFLVFLLVKDPVLVYTQVVRAVFGKEQTMDINLVLLKKNGSTKSFSLGGDVTTLGRRQDCDLCIPLMIISRRHCELRRKVDGLCVKDLSSRNGTFVNGQKIDEIKIGAGDKIQVGPVTFAVQVNGQPAGDSAILRPPTNISSSEEKVVIDEARELADIEDVETILGHNGIPEEANNNNTNNN